MIHVSIIRDKSGKIVSFTVRNHGEDIVCAAVSMLVMNTVNSIEYLTEDEFSCNYNENGGGYLTFSLTDPANRSDAIDTLLDSMYLGLKSALEEYPDEVEIEDVRSNHPFGGGTEKNKRKQKGEKPT